MITKKKCEAYAKQVGKAAGVSFRIVRTESRYYDLFMGDTHKQFHVSLREIMEFLTGFESAVNWMNR